MIRHYCDRCGEDITRQIKRHFSTKDIIFEGMERENCDDTTRMELCKHCADMLKLWMERGQGNVRGRGADVQDLVPR